MERFVVGIDGISEGLPRIESAVKKFDAGEILLASLCDDEAAGLVSGACAVDDDVPVARNDVWVSNELAGRDAAGGRDDIGVSEEIKGKPDVVDKSQRPSGEVCVQLFGGDAVVCELVAVPAALEPDDDHGEAEGNDNDARQTMVIFGLLPAHRVQRCVVRIRGGVARMQTFRMEPV